MDFHNGKAIQVGKDEENNSPCSQGEDGFSLPSSSVKKLTGSYGNLNSWSKEIAPGGRGGGGSVCYGQPVVGLQLQMPKDSENMSSARHSVPSNTSKRQRLSSQSGLNPRKFTSQSLNTSRCQVEGCNIDLTTAKDYHRRHRICECHSKSPKVIVAGMERRFCQQCSRLHNLSEFDEQKRSCRRRLSDHNARRRRPHPGAMHLSSMGGLTSSLYDGRPPSFLLNRLASSLSNASWDSSCNLRMAQVGSSLMRTSGNDGRRQFFIVEIPNPVFQQDLNNGNASAANSYMNETPNLPHALSLLSPTTPGWGLNHPESTPLDQFMQGTAGIAQPVMPLDSQEWPLTSAEPPPSISPLQSTFKIFDG